jgi:hypothetical protein
VYTRTSCTSAALDDHPDIGGKMLKVQCELVPVSITFVLKLKVKVKVKVTLEQSTKAQRGSSGIALLFL